MSAKTLQRLAVRMLHDPALVAAVYERPDEALAGLELAPVERDSILATDRRAWLADPERPDRVFEAIRREYPVSAALAEVASRGREGLLRFFSSEDFHDCVQQRGTLVLVFGGWLQSEARDGRLGKRAVASVAALESASAQLRRSGDRPCGWKGTALPGALRCSSHLRLLRLPQGSLALFERVQQRLAAGSPIPPGRLAGSDTEWVLVELRGGGLDGLSLGVIPGGLAAILEAAEESRATGELLALVRKLGGDEGDEEEALLGILSEGLLVAAD